MDELLKEYAAYEAFNRHGDTDEAKTYAEDMFNNGKPTFKALETDGDNAVIEFDRGDDDVPARYLKQCEGRRQDDSPIIEWLRLDPRDSTDTIAGAKEWTIRHIGLE